MIGTARLAQPAVIFGGFSIHKGEDHLLPDDLGRWDLVIRIEGPRPFHNDAAIERF